jgi:dephospho-CoA kinase
MNEKSKEEREKIQMKRKKKVFLSRVLSANRGVIKHMSVQETKEIKEKMMRLILPLNQLILS